MFIKTVSILVVALAYNTSAASCGNHGATRCLSANGLGSAFVKCEYGVEVEYECEGSTLCYGSGTSGIMCIAKPQASKRQTTSSSTFGGYEGSINQLIDGVNGNTNSLNSWLKNARASMFTDKNAISNVAAAMNKGIIAKSANIGNGINNLKNLRTTAAGQTTIINNAKKFMVAATANKNDFGYFMNDISNNAANSVANRQGLSSMLTNTYASGKNPITAAGQNSVVSALNNLRAITSIYTPRTFGAIFKGGLLPATIGPQLYRGTNGDVNATDAMFTSLLSQLKGRTSGLAGFYTAAAVTSNKVAANVNPGVISKVLGKYRSSNPSGVGLADTINGVANVFANVGTKYNAQVSQIVNQYTRDAEVICPGCGAPPECNCNDEDFNALLLSILLLLSAGLIGTPSTSCCYTSKNLFAARSLVA
ncbi:hypothetical protein AYI70_g8492 [Smittium culicis]|uniref:Uncharacterized protein n=1 Tax=Smittium culicis TaxID=133412 RepID=A0A1R1XFN5_9FUNG|nr:hypothetical protein AYI70_g8492 [Smittium culicis]